MGELLKYIPAEESKEKDGLLTYHHCRPLSAVTYGTVYQEPPMSYAKDGWDMDLAEYFHKNYLKLKNLVGFYPVFLAVGRTEEDLRMTGYQNQWKRIVEKSREKTVYVNKGEFQNNVMFSFKDLPEEAVFTDFMVWHEIMCSGEPTPRQIQRLLKPSFIKNDWITFANKNPHGVQLLVPCLDLRKAGSVFVRNRETKEYLESLGFGNVTVARLINERF